MNLANVQAEVIVSREAQVIINNLKASVRNSPTGVAFVSLKGYTSSTSGEVADHLINIGVSYAKAGEKDIKDLENADLTKLSNDQFSVILLEEARTALINSIVAPSKSYSNAQKDAYTHICEGMKVHNETGSVVIFGHAVRKTVIVKGEYKTVNSRPLTLAKNYLSKELNLRRDKYRNFTVTSLEGIKLNGQEF